MPCSTITVLGYPTGVTCTVTLTSSSRATTVITSTLMPGPSYRCESGGGKSVATGAVFVPRDIAVDFNEAGDAGAP